MTNIVVFEGVDEVIVATTVNINAVIKDWFLEGNRCLENYDIYLADGEGGFSVTTRLRFDDDMKKDFDVVELMPHDLRKALIAKDLLDSESYN